MTARKERCSPHLILLRSPESAAQAGARQGQRAASGEQLAARVQGAPATPLSELSPLRDTQVRAAIERMRAQLDAPWTVTRLARSVGLSRPAFARRFVESTGLSPLKYLTRCRMERAAELLRTSDLGLAAVGGLVGYGSEFAFNRAFKRHFHVAPGTYRRMFRMAPHLELRMAA